MMCTVRTDIIRTFHRPAAAAVYYAAYKHNALRAYLYSTISRLVDISPVLRTYIVVKYNTRIAMPTRYLFVLTFNIRTMNT